MEILDLECPSFQLFQCAVISPKRLFRIEELPSNLSSYPIPASPEEHLKIRSGKNIQRIKNMPTIKQANNPVSSLTLMGQFWKVMMIPHLGFRCIISLAFGVLLKVQQYLITIGSFPDWSCKLFKDISTKSLGKRGGWASCKHLYFVFTVIGNLNSERDAFIHAPSFSFNEVK